MHNDRMNPPSRAAWLARALRRVAGRRAPAVRLLRRRRGRRLGRRDQRRRWRRGLAARAVPARARRRRADHPGHRARARRDRHRRLRAAPGRGRRARHHRDPTGQGVLRPVHRVEARRPRPSTTQPYFVHATITQRRRHRPRRPPTAAVRRRRRQQADRVLDVRQHVQAVPERGLPEDVQDRRHGQDLPGLPRPRQGRPGRGQLPPDRGLRPDHLGRRAHPARAPEGDKPKRSDKGKGKGDKNQNNQGGNNNG